MNLSPRLKKILVIIGFVALVFILAWLIYIFFFKSYEPGVTQPLPGDTLQLEGLPQIGEGDSGRIVDTGEVDQVAQLPDVRSQVDYVKEVKTLVEEPVKGLFASSQGSLVYYNTEDSKFYKYTTGEIQPLSDKSFYNVDEITWSGSGSRAILEYPDGHNIFYDFARGKQISLPKEMEDFSFDNRGEKIAAKIITGYEESNWIVTANYDGSGMSFIEHLGDKSFDVDINWSPAGEIVATYREGIDFERQEVYPIGQSGGNIKSLVTAGRGFASQWSPQGDFILYNVYNSSSGYRPTLWLSDMGGDWTGSYNVSLGLNTWSDKCVFTADSRYVYCAVPEELPELSGIFKELGDDSSDVLYRINVVTGNKQLVALPEDGKNNINMQSLSLSPNEDILYFIEQATGEIKSIELR